MRVPVAQTTEAKEGAVAADQKKIIGKHGKGDGYTTIGIELDAPLTI